MVSAVPHRFISPTFMECFATLDFDIFHNFGFRLCSVNRVSSGLPVSIFLSHSHGMLYVCIQFFVYHVLACSLFIMSLI
jgi:hypothetical protein